MYAEKLKVPETLSFVLSKFVIVIVPIDVLVSGLKEENAPLIEPIAVSKYCNKLKLLLSVLAGKVPTEGFIIWREIDFPLLVNPLIINWSPNAVSEKSPMVWAATKLDEWKKHSTIEKEKTSHKELVGLVFKNGYKITIELLDEKAQSALERGKFEVSHIKDN